MAPRGGATKLYSRPQMYNHPPLHRTPATSHFDRYASSGDAVLVRLGLGRVHAGGRGARRNAKQVERKNGRPRKDGYAGL